MYSEMKPQINIRPLVAKLSTHISKVSVPTCSKIKFIPSGYSDDNTSPKFSFV